MSKLIDALTVRTRFGEIMETVERKQVRYVVSRRGKAKNGINERPGLPEEHRKKA